MNDVVNFKQTESDVIGEEIGRVFISMYKDKFTDLPFFYVKSENEKVLSLSLLIENFLKNFKS